MNFTKKKLAKLTILATGSLALLALTGCTASDPETTSRPTTEVTSSSQSDIPADHLDVAVAFQAPSGWELIKESDRTKPDGTEVHNLRWDTGDTVVTIDEIKALFDQHGYTVENCYEQIINCKGTAPIENGTVGVSISGVAWKDTQTREDAGNEVFMDVSKL